MKVYQVIIIALLGIPLILTACKGCGEGGWGPDNDVEATVMRTYVDHAEHSSHYIVVTDHGAFEVDNGALLGMFNADEVFGSIKEGRTYRFHTKGKRWQNIVAQIFPFITSAIEVHVSGDRP